MAERQRLLDRRDRVTVLTLSGSAGGRSGQSVTSRPDHWFAMAGGVRPAVVNRKVWGGNWTVARHQERLMTVVRTAS